MKPYHTNQTLHPEEKTIATIILDENPDYDHDIQEIDNEAKEEKIIYMTLFVTMILYLLTIIAW